MKRDVPREQLEELISRYDRLIRKKAASCMSKAARYDAALAFDDLYQAGVIGLVEAYRTFDDSLGVPLQAHLALRITYAVYIEYTRSSQMSPHFRAVRRMLENDRDMLERIYGRPVNDEELAEFLELPVAEVEKVLAKAHAASPEIVPFCDIPEGVEELYLSDGGDSVEHATNRSEVQAHLMNAMECLVPRERFILSSLYFEAMTLEAVGRVLGVSKQRVMVLRDTALVKMRTKLPDDIRDVLGE